MVTVESSWDTKWEDVFRSQEWGKYPPEHVIRFVARRWYGAPDRKAIRLLDLGCGTGACAWFMAREGFSVSGIDGSTAAIEQGLNRLKQEGLEADLRVGDYISLPWPDNYFDGVIENASLCCNRMENCRRVIDEVVRVLVPGGSFLSCNLTDRTWGYGLGDEVEPGGFTNVTEGPLAGKGFVLFMGRAVIDELYKPFVDQQVDRVAWTLDGMQHQVETWVAHMRKPR